MKRCGRLRALNRPDGPDNTYSVEQSTSAQAGKSSAAGRVSELDGIRAIAIAVVLVYHANAGSGPTVGGHLGVVVFFVLSGYLITGLLFNEYRARGNVDIRGFMVRRVARLLPALILVLVVTAPVTYALNGWPEIVGAISTLLYSANVVAAFWGEASVGSFSWGWTLSLEEQFYLVWPFVLLWFLRRDKNPIPALLVTIAMSTLLRFVLPLEGDPPAQLYFSPWTRWDALAAGCLLAVVSARCGWRERKRGSVVGDVSAMSALALLAVTVALSGTTGRATYAIFLPLCVVAASALIWSLVACQSGLVARCLAMPPIAYIGRISYGLYLWNFPILVVVWALPLGTVMSALIWSVSTFGLAVASFHLVELPFQRRILRRFPPVRVPVEHART